MTDLPAGLEFASLFNGRNVARPERVSASQRMARAASSSVSTTTEAIPAPIAVARADSWASSFGAHNSAMVPITPVSSPLSLAAITALAPPARPFAPDFSSISALALERRRSASLNLFSTRAVSSVSCCSVRCDCINAPARASLSYSGA